MQGATGPHPSAQLPIAPRFTTAGAPLLGSPSRYGSGAEEIRGGVALRDPHKSILRKH